MKTERNKRSTRYGMVQLGEVGEVDYKHYKIVSGQKLLEMQKDEHMEKVTVVSVSNEGGDNNGEDQEG